MTQQSRLSRLFRLLLVGAIALTSMALMSISSGTRRANAQNNVLLEDTFEDNSHNWMVASSKYTDLAVDGGMLTLHLKGSSHAGWTTPDQTLTDNIQLDVDAQPDTPDTSGDYNFGVIIRADGRDDSSSFYQFDVDGKSNWAFSIRTTNGDQYEPIKNGKLKNFDVLAVTHFQVIAQGDTFTYSVNGTKLGTFEDTTLSSPNTEKYVGLVISNYAQVSESTVNFTNLKVTTAPKTVNKVTSTQEASQPTGKILLQDDFSDNTNNWLIGRTDNTTISLADNALTIKVSKNNLFQRSVPDMTFSSDIDMTVTVQNIDPDTSGDWNYGIGIRGRTEDDEALYYLFRVTGQGTWLFLSRKGGDTVSTVVDETPIDGFDVSASNTLRIVAVGKHFDFYINDVKVGQADDDSLPNVDQNEIYLTAGTFEKSNSITAVFSNLVVAEPATTTQ